MNEQPLDLRRMLRAVVRRWLLILVLFWAGCGGAYVAASKQEALYVARSSVLLPPSPVEADGTPSRNILTQVNIARNGNILDRAGRVVNPPLSARKMRGRIEVSALTSDILEVRAEAPTGRDAARLADAVAKEYVAEATAATSKLSGTSISGLEAQKAEVEARLQQAKADINAATARASTLPADSPERARATALLDSLHLDEVDAARQVSSLGDKIAEARLQDQLSREGTRLLAPAIVPAEPARPKIIVYTVAGGVLGLAAGVVLALLLDGRDDRIRGRSEIAEVVAAPVLGSLETPRRVSARTCRVMLQHWEPRPLQSWALRQACTRLGLLHGAGRSHLVVVGLPGDTASPLLALQLALFAASMGTRTALVVASPHPTAARLRSACHREISAGEVRPYLTTYGESVGSYQDHRDQPELMVRFVVAEPSGGELEDIPDGVITTLGVSSGFANPDRLAAAALACLDAGHPLVGVFLANPDPSDPTSGDPLLGVPVLGAHERSVDALEPGSNGSAGTQSSLSPRPPS